MSRFQGNPFRESIWLTSVVFVLVSFHAFGQAAAAYPEKNIRVIVHVPPGGGTDVMARLVLRYAGERLGTNFVIENHSGAGGQVGYTVLSQAKPDGYTIGTITTMSIVTHELTRRDVVYRFADSFISIAQITEDPSALVVRTDSRWADFQALLREAKEKPGTINCAGTFLWGTHHVHTMLLARATGMELNYIPFDGNAEVLGRVQGGHLNLAVDGLSQFVPLIEAGKLRALAVASAEPLAWAPDIPCYGEMGLSIVSSSRRGFAVPAGTPREIVETLSRTMGEVVRDPAFLEDARRMKIAPILAYRDAATFRKELGEVSKAVMPLVREYETETSASPYTAKFFLLVVLPLCGFTLCLIVQETLAFRKGTKSVGQRLAGWIQERRRVKRDLYPLVVVGLTFAYVLAFPFGFEVSVFGLVLGVMLLIDRREAIRKFYFALVMPAIALLILSLAFDFRLPLLLERIWDL